MRKKMLKAVMVVAAAGTLLQFGGCLGGNFVSAVLANIVANQVGGTLNLTSLLGGLGT